MTPRVPSNNGGVGKSHTGAAQYFLHDEGHAKTDERVLWTETHNIGTDDPELAARVMAATAMSARHLQERHHASEQAKLPEDERTKFRAPRPSFNHVFHFSLSWSGEKEGHTLTREEMTNAAKGALRALGAEHLQALIVAHDHETAPHVHVQVNRVNPDTGMTEKPESNSQRKLSAWALEYERQRGFILCPNRERNAMFRDVGTRYSEQKISPQDYRARQSAAEEIAADPQAAKRFAAEQKLLDKALSDATKDMQRRHKADLDGLYKDHNRRKAEINRFAHQNKDHSERKTRDEYNPRFLHQRSEQEKEIDRFVDAEASTFGKARNIRDALKATWEERQTSSRGLLGAMSETLFNSSARLQAMQRGHERDRQAMQSQMNSEIEASKAFIEAERKAAIDMNYQRLQDERSDLLIRHAEEKLANADAWSDRGNERIDAWKEFAAQQRLETDFDDASGSDDRTRQLEEHEGEALQQFQAATEQDNYDDDGEEEDSRPLTPQEQAAADKFAEDLGQRKRKAIVIPRAKVDKLTENKAANEQTQERGPDLSDD